MLVVMPFLFFVVAAAVFMLVMMLAFLFVVLQRDIQISSVTNYAINAVVVNKQVILIIICINMLVIIGQFDRVNLFGSIC